MNLDLLKGGSEYNMATEGPTHQFTVITADMVNVFITSNITMMRSEKRFVKSLSIGELKNKLEMITGASSASMKITVFNKDDKEVCSLADDTKMLGSYPVDNGHRLEVTDNSKVAGEFENTAAVDKFELSKEDYSKRRDTVQSYLKNNKMGKYNEEEMADLAAEKIKQEEEEKKLIDDTGIVDGARCQVTVAGSSKRRGTIKFVGNVHFQPGWWVGVQYDEPNGKNDGSVGGQRYFTCQNKYGGFVKPAKVEAGDFPEEELDFSDGEM